MKGNLIKKIHGKRRIYFIKENIHGYFAEVKSKSRSSQIKDSIMKFIGIESESDLFDDRYHPNITLLEHRILKDNKKSK